MGLLELEETRLTGLLSQREFGAPATVAAVADLLNQHFSAELRVRDISYLGHGGTNVAYHVNSQFVFRLPHSEKGGRAKVERWLLPALHAHGVQVPRLRYVGVPSAEFPRWYLGYEWAGGVKLNGARYHALPPEARRRVLAQLAAMVVGMQRIPVFEAAIWGCVNIMALNEDKRRVERSLAKAGEAVSPELSRLKQVYDTTPLLRERWPSLVNMDFNDSHWLYDDQSERLVMIDLEDFFINHPLKHYWQLAHALGEEAAVCVLNASEANDLRRRALSEQLRFQLEFQHEARKCNAATT